MPRDMAEGLHGGTGIRAPSETDRTAGGRLGTSGFLKSAANSNSYGESRCFLVRILLGFLLDDDFLLVPLDPFSNGLLL